MDWKGVQPELLLPACADGQEPRAREEFVRRYGEVIERTVRRIAGRWGTPPSDTLADLVQDTYAKFFGGALKSYRHLHAESDFGFVKTVAANCVLDYFRKKAVPSVSLECASEPIAPGTDPDRSIALAEIERTLQMVLPDKSRERDRQVFLLYYRHGMTAKAIAGLQSVGLTTKGVESLIHSMTTALRAELRNGPRLSVEETV